MSAEVDFLLINPWIYDFSAYDFWLKPYGLLILGGKLRASGYRIFYLDLLDPFSPLLPKLPKRRHYGTGHFYKEPIPKPYFLKDVPRKFYRYGLPVRTLEQILSNIKFKAVMISCTMTYWYPGIFVLLEYFIKRFPQTPLYVGGIYVKLCENHLKSFLETCAREAEVCLVKESAEEFISRLSLTYQPSSTPHPHDYPIFDLQTKIPYVVLITSYGCPFNCPYCASKKLFSSYQEKSPDEVWKEILYWYENFGVRDFAFYDDALLFNFENKLKPVLEKVIDHNLDINFHTPNAIHARFVNREVAKLLKLSGFKTIRIGLERVENRFDNKITLEEFLDAVSYLKEAGFSEREIGAYLLYGIPDEDFDEVERALIYLEKVRVPPYLAEFSPIPGTPFFERAKLSSRYNLEDDPLFHNKSIFPALKNPDWEKIEKLKRLAKNIRLNLQKS